MKKWKSEKFLTLALKSFWLIYKSSNFSKYFDIFKLFEGTTTWTVMTWWLKHLEDIVINIFIFMDFARILVDLTIRYSNSNIYLITIRHSLDFLGLNLTASGIGLHHRLHWNRPISDDSTISRNYMTFHRSMVAALVFDHLTSKSVLRHSIE